MDAVSRMRQSDLNRIGVALVGHQKKILDNIKLLNEANQLRLSAAHSTGDVLQRGMPSSKGGQDGFLV